MNDNSVTVENELEITPGVQLSYSDRDCDDELPPLSVWYQYCGWFTATTERRLHLYAVQVNSVIGSLVRLTWGLYTGIMTQNSC